LLEHNRHDKIFDGGEATKEQFQLLKRGHSVMLKIQRGRKENRNDHKIADGASIDKWNRVFIH
jgi:hypothetical protein